LLLYINKLAGLQIILIVDYYIAVYRRTSSYWRNRWISCKLYDLSNSNHSA